MHIHRVLYNWSYEWGSVSGRSSLYDLLIYLDTEQDPEGLLGIEVFLHPSFLDHRKYASFSLRSLPSAELTQPMWGFWPQGWGPGWHLAAEQTPGLLELPSPKVSGVWTIRKAEHRRIDPFKLWCWRRLLRVPWTVRRSNQSILKEINPEHSLEELMLKMKCQYFVTWWWEQPTRWKSPWCWERLKAEEGIRR